MNQMLALKPALVLEGVLWEVIRRCGTVSCGALVAPTGPRKAICIFRRPLLSAAVEKAEDHHQSPNCQDPPAKMAWLLNSGIICLVLWYMLLKLPFNVLFQGACLWCFYHLGKCSTRNDHVPGNFL